MKEFFFKQPWQSFEKPRQILSSSYDPDSNNNDPDWKIGCVIIYKLVCSEKKINS